MKLLGKDQGYINSTVDADAKPGIHGSRQLFFAVSHLDPAWGSLWEHSPGTNDCGQLEGM